MGCLSDDEALAFALGRLSGPALARAEEHVNACAACRRLVGEALKYFSEQASPGGVADPAGASDATRLLRPGANVARFEVLGLLGLGSSGVVYRARDPQLERQVALKLVRPDITDADLAEKWRRRFLFEAQAMARLSHPNVVVVYEAGLLAGEAFIAMELVEGDSLTSWLEASPRDWRQVAGVFMQLGRGLEAAHAAGLIHGDFKPENVLIGRDGRARISDFGLARPLLETSASRAPALKLAGTPLYMAPELLAGRPADEKSDQFSFCVALFRAVYGYHPFDPPAAAARGEVRKPSAGHAVPPEIYGVLLRGLRPSPDDRHASIRALIEALERAVRRAALRLVGRRVATAGLGAAVMALLAALLWRAAQAPRCGNGRTEPGEECDDGRTASDGRCTGECRFARCGDGHLRAGFESCDDGNARDGDGCTSSCVACPSGALEAQGRCYVRIAGRARWSEAQAACAARGADLLSSGDARSDAVTAWLAQPGEPLWTARRQAGEARDCPVLEGSPLRAAAAACDQPAGIVCETSGWFGRAGSSHAYRVLAEPATWDGAVERCGRLGARLTMTEDPAEHAFLAERVPIAFWIAATDRGREGEFRSLGGQPLAYEGFARGEPDDVDGRNDCVAIDRDRRWHDRPCVVPYGVVCEAD